MELVTRIELATCGLRYRCTTFVLHKHLILSFSFARLATSVCDVALPTTHDPFISGQKYSRLAQLSPSQFSLFLPFADSFHLPLAAVVCSANELLYRLSHTSIYKADSEIHLYLLEILIIT